MEINYIDIYKRIINWIENSLDTIRNNIIVIEYPLFVYLFIELLKNENYTKAKKFFDTFKNKFKTFDNELSQLCLLKDPINFNCDILSKYINNKVHIYVKDLVFEVFMHFLYTSKLSLILEIINKYFEKSNLMSKVKNNNFVLLNLNSDGLEKINCRTAIYTNKIKKDTDLNFTSKKTKLEKSVLSKAYIPIPEQYFDLENLDNSCLKIDNNNLPTIGVFTMLNTYNKMNCCDFSKDGSIIAIGFKNGLIKLYLMYPEGSNSLNKNIKNIPNGIDEDLIYNLEIYKENYYNKMIKGGEIDIEIENDSNRYCEEDHPSNMAWDNILSKRRHYNLLGHLEAVYSLSICNSNQYLISGSFDNTIRLWSIILKQTISIYKGHFSPVLTVKFSPLTHYFASGGCDRTCKLWSINYTVPLRIFVGHLADVEIIEFHPNGLYLATAANDSTIRLWSLETGECVRVIYNYSNIEYADAISFCNNGKVMAVAFDKALIIYDLIKMGDPIKIIDNFTDSTIYSMSFDIEDSVIAVSTDNYKISLFDFHLLLNDQLPIRINLKDYNNIRKECSLSMDSKKNINFFAEYLTKKTALLKIKFTNSNIIIALGRFDDNDSKIFM